MHHRILLVGYRWAN